jgi:hypothetical protein
MDSWIIEGDNPFVHPSDYPSWNPFSSGVGFAPVEIVQK